MLPDDHPDRIQIAFDDHRLVNNAGLILPATLALHLGLPQLVDRHLGLGRAPGRANPGDKMMTLVASALAGEDCIDDADALRTGGTAGAIGCVVKAPSTPRFREGRLWAPFCAASGGGTSDSWIGWAGSCWPGPGPLGRDRTTRHSPLIWTPPSARPMVWSRKARATTATPASGAIPLLAVAAGTGDVLMSLLREGRANTVRGAAHFLRETVGRVRYGGASGQLTVRADSGCYAHAILTACRKMKVRFSITVRQHQSLRNLIEAIPEQDWTPIPYWMDGAAGVAETSFNLILLDIYV